MSGVYRFVWVWPGRERQLSYGPDMWGRLSKGADGRAVSEGNGRLLWGLARMCGAWQSWNVWAAFGVSRNGSQGTSCTGRELHGMFGQSRSGRVGIGSVVFVAARKGSYGELCQVDAWPVSAVVYWRGWGCMVGTVKACYGSNGLSSFVTVWPG